MRQRWLRTLFRRRVLTILLLLLQVWFLVNLVIGGSQLSRRLSRLLTIISIVAVLYIVSKRDKGAYKTAWAILILAFPLFGGLMYLLFNFQSSRWRFTKGVREAQRKAKPFYTLPGNDYEEATKQLPERRAQIRYLQSSAGFPVYADTATHYLTPGEKKLEVLLTELEKAEKYIFMEYFIVQEGVMWDSILAILKRKASEGVIVRLIYDDMGCFFTLPKNYPAQLKKYGIQCAVFNPFRPVLTVKQNNRDHRKIAVIDGKVAFTGGINLADEYINVKEKHGHWKDAAIMLEGKAAWSFTLIFLQMWYMCTHTEEDYAVFYPWQEQPCPIVAKGFVQPYADSPTDSENVGEHVYLQILNNAKEYVYINTPYLIVDDSMLSALCLAAKSGVDVRIVTPHIWDKRIVHMTTRSYYRELIKAGVKIYEYTNGFIHSKTFVSDDHTATVGTTNLDFRSLYLHFECGTVLYESDAVMEVKEDFLQTLDICQQITEKDCSANIVLRLVQDVLRLFAPLM